MSKSRYEEMEKAVTAAIVGAEFMIAQYDYSSGPHSETITMTGILKLRASAVNEVSDAANLERPVKIEVELSVTVEGVIVR